MPASFSNARRRKRLLLMCFIAGGLKDHNFLASRVNRNIDYLLGILTLRAIDWYINESIMRGPGGGREGQGIFGRVSRLLLGHFYKV